MSSAKARFGMLFAVTNAARMALCSAATATVCRSEVIGAVVALADVADGETSGAVSSSVDPDERVIAGYDKFSARFYVEVFVR